MPITSEAALLLFGPGVQNPEDVSPISGIPTGWESQSGGVKSPITIDLSAPERALHILWLDELKTVSWELQLSQVDDYRDYDVTCSLADSVARSGWNSTRGKRSLRGSMNFANYLGTASIEVRYRGIAVGEPLRFDVITRKLEFESEYHALVESIAAECQQLLLDWGSPTAINITTDPEARVQTLLEQFLFLRHVLGSDRLDLFLETLQQHPHTKLEHEQRWRPTAIADSRLFLRDPLRFSRDWRRTGRSSVGRRLGAEPLEVLEERKFESLDTPPNQFVKFALQEFHALCEVVMDQLDDEKGAAWLEARQMRDSLDAFIAGTFFDEVGDLKRLPLESQTLQKRDGYRDVLHAWLMLDAEAQIDWPGRNDAYDGTNRDVATLYEYWLYFTIVRALQRTLGMKPMRDVLERNGSDALPFCCIADDGRLRINLKEGQTSFSCFRWQSDIGELWVHFFYNRRFSASEVHQRGTYSRPLRPDYTLVIIPSGLPAANWRGAERLAEQAGTIAYLHFDAKYRIDTLVQLFGEREVRDEELDAEKQASKTTGTFKRADLYKMHTYNEAIRRTVGSYVLYPGDDPKNVEGENRFERYHEIIPGVGAFALKPASTADEQPAGLQFLVDFIGDILSHQLSRFTQSHRISYWTESTVAEPASSYGNKRSDFLWTKKPPKDTQILLGFVRSETEAQQCRSAASFFCHGVEWKHWETMTAGASTDLEFDPFRSELLAVYNANKTAPWVAEVSEVKLVRAAERAAETGRPPNEMNAAYYYRFQLKNFQDVEPRNVAGLVKKRPGRPVAHSLSAFALCAMAT